MSKLGQPLTVLEVLARWGMTGLDYLYVQQRIKRGDRWAEVLAEFPIPRCELTVARGCLRVWFKYPNSLKV